jgi:stage III sporulation protein AG
MRERGRICLKSFSWKTIQNKLKSMNRTDWLIVLLFGVLLLVIAVPSGSGKSGNADSTQSQEDGTGSVGSSEKDPTGQAEGDSAGENAGSGETAQTAYMSAYRQQLEEELAELLSQMDGVGKVQVMLTLKDSGADVLDKNVKRDGDASETDTVVYSKSDGEEPYVTNRFTPDVDGVFIVAEGGGNAVIVSNISDAVMALFGIEAHKIKIVKMSD